MWVYLSNSFLSIVQHKDKLLVRARMQRWGDNGGDKFLARLIPPR